MALAHLLTFPSDKRGQNAWAFDHQQAHSSLTFAMTPPVTFSGANYLLDPFQNADLNSGNWQQSHQQAHDDAANYFGVQPSQQLIDQPVGNNWWTWINFSEHLALSQAAFRTTLG